MIITIHRTEVAVNICKKTKPTFHCRFVAFEYNNNKLQTPTTTSADFGCLKYYAGIDYYWPYIVILCDESEINTSHRLAFVVV